MDLQSLESVVFWFEVTPLQRQKSNCSEEEFNKLKLFKKNNDHEFFCTAYYYYLRFSRALATKVTDSIIPDTTSRPIRPSLCTFARIAACNNMALFRSGSLSDNLSQSTLASLYSPKCSFAIAVQNKQSLVNAAETASSIRSCNSVTAYICCFVLVSLRG